MSFSQDDETIPKELRDTKEYWEILQLKRLKRKRSEQELVSFENTTQSLAIFLLAVVDVTNLRAVKTILDKKRW